MRRRDLARVWFGLNALVVLVGLVVQLVVTATTTGGFYPTNPQRVFNVFAFFTVQSNVLVGVTSLLLAVRPEPGGLLRRTLRLDALLGIAVTGVVFHLALRQLQDLRGSAALADLLLHTVSPVMCVLGWLLLGAPRRGQRPGRGLGSGISPALAGLHPRPRIDHRLLAVPFRGCRCARAGQGARQLPARRRAFHGLGCRRLPARPPAPGRVAAGLTGVMQTPCRAHPQRRR